VPAVPLSGTGLVSYPAVVLPDAPAAYYRLGETGAVAADQAGGPNGSYGGTITQAQPSLLPSGDGKSLYVNGGGVAIPDAPANELGAGDFSIECWVRIPGGAGGYQTFVDNPNRNYSLFFQSSSYWYVGVGGPGGGGSIAYAATDWTTTHHVVVTVSGSSFSTWIDGVQSGPNVTGHGTQNSASGFAIAENPSGGGAGLSAYLQEFALYNKVLTPARIQAHYNAGLGIGAPITAQAGTRATAVVFAPVAQPLTPTAASGSAASATISIPARLTPVAQAASAAQATVTTPIAQPLTPVAQAASSATALVTARVSLTASATQATAATAYVFVPRTVSLQLPLAVQVFTAGMRADAVDSTASAAVTPASAAIAVEDSTVSVLAFDTRILASAES